MNRTDCFFDAVTPESAGIPSQAVIRFLDELETEELTMHGFIMMKGSTVFAEGYYAPFHVDFPHRMYSIGKSFTSVAIGLLQEEGKLSIHDKICDYFPDKLPEQGVHPYIQQTTIRDMLCMATPHKMTTYKQMDCEDWVKTFFHVKPVRHPGTSFVYDTSSSHVLSALVERLSGMSLLDYLRSKVLDEIGCSSNIRWLKDPMGICQGGSGFICTLRDLARFAHVCMNEGTYQGKQILPKDYIREATSRQIDTSLQPGIEEQQGYGYQIWQIRNNGFALYGMGGQLAVCLPDYDFMLLTVADNQGNPYGVQGIYEALWHQILPCLKLNNQPLAEDSVAYQNLKERIASLAVKPEKGSPQSELVSSIHGKKYVLAPNPMDIIECSFTFEKGKEGTFYYENSTGKHKITFGFGRFMQQIFPDTNYNSMTSAAWVEENKLHIRSFIIDDCMGNMNMTATFVQDTVTLAMKKTAEDFLNKYEGFASGEAE